MMIQTFLGLEKVEEVWKEGEVLFEEEQEQKRGKKKGIEENSTCFGHVLREIWED